MACADLIYTIAGTGTAGYSGDGGAATSATLYQPSGIAIDSSGEILYFANVRSNVVRPITISTGIIATIAGSGDTNCGTSADSMNGLNLINSICLQIELLYRLHKVYNYIILIY
jgi:DNA-binding beta-propeller fold protein YncE